MCSRGAAMFGITPFPSSSFLCTHFFFSPISDLLCVVFIWLEMDKLRFLVPQVFCSHDFCSLMSLALSRLCASVWRLGSGLGLFSCFSSTASCEWSKHFVDFCTENIKLFNCTHFNMKIYYLLRLEFGLIKIMLKHLLNIPKTSFKQMLGFKHAPINIPKHNLTL